MIEMIMYFGIGFLCASLLGLVIVPLVHNRAARLTARRLEAATPLSMAEIQADKDQLRAEFAISTRRLELTIEQLKARSTNQLSELGKKTETIAILKHELGEKSAALDELEAREKTLREQLHVTEQEHSAKSTSLHETEIALTEHAASLARMAAELGQRNMTTDSQRAEIAALTLQIDALQAELQRFEKEVRDTEEHLVRKRDHADTATKELAEERSKAEHLGNRVAQLERQLVAQTTDAEILGRRVPDLEARLADQGRLLAEGERAVSQLLAELDVARNAATDLRTDIPSSGGRRQREPAGTAQTDNIRLQTQLAKVSEERTRLQHEVAALKRDAESTLASERVENALLRERINDIAAEVARLTMALEGPNSPIEAILAAEPPSVGNGAGTGENRGERGKGNLADRIRALQDKASRLSTVS